MDKESAAIVSLSTSVVSSRPWTWKFTDTYFAVGAEIIYAYKYGDYYIGEWTPTISGNYNVIFTAKTSANGESSANVNFELKQNTESIKNTNSLN